jgi:hypothetical protein
VNAIGNIFSNCAESQHGAPPIDAFFLNRAFWFQHHFEPKKRAIFGVHS